MREWRGRFLLPQNAGVDFLVKNKIILFLRSGQNGNNCRFQIHNNCGFHRHQAVAANTANCGFTATLISYRLNRLAASSIASNSSSRPPFGFPIPINCLAVAMTSAIVWSLGRGVCSSSTLAI